MGMSTGSTRAAGISDLDRCALLGQTLDLNTVTSLFSLASAWTEQASAELLSQIALDDDSRELAEILEQPKVQELFDRLQLLAVAFEEPSPEPGRIPDGFSFDINPSLAPQPA